MLNLIFQVRFIILFTRYELGNALMRMVKGCSLLSLFAFIVKCRKYNPNRNNYCIMLFYGPYCIKHNLKLMCGVWDIWLLIGLFNIICQGGTGPMGEAGLVGNPGIDVSENASCYFMSTSMHYNNNNNRTVANSKNKNNNVYYISQNNHK